MGNPAAETARLAWDVARRGATGQDAPRRRVTAQVGMPHEALRKKEWKWTVKCCIITLTRDRFGFGQGLAR